MAHAQGMSSLTIHKFAHNIPLYGNVKHAITPKRQLIECMAHPRRVARVAKQIEREVGTLLTYDKLMQEAVCPERRRGLDNAVSAIASITDVHVSNDLQLAKIYLSIYSDDAGKEAAMLGLQRLEGYVRKHVGRQVRLRLTPEIRFVRDESTERTERVLALLDQIKKIESGEAPPPPIVIPEDDDDEEEDDEEYDDDEDDVEIVDLGFFPEGDEERRNVGAVKKTDRSSGNRQDDKKGGREMSNDEVEEMMSYFKQESTVAGKKGRINTSKRR